MVGDKVFIVVLSAMLLGLPVWVQQARADETSAESFQYVSKSIKELQRKLARAGYHPGRPDGIFGPQTSLAISQYQKDHGLPQTGYPDATFLDHINNKRRTDKSR